MSKAEIDEGRFGVLLAITMSGYGDNNGPLVKFP